MRAEVQEVQNAEPVAAPAPRPSGLGRFLRVFLRSGLAAAGLVIVTGLILTAVFASQVAPYDPNALHPRDALKPPSAQYWMGTDDLGRDIFSRVVHSSRASLMVGVIAIGIAGAAGIPLGLVGGYFGGWPDTVIMRTMDALLAFPAVLLAIALMAVLGPSLQNAMVAIGIIYIPTFARITRANVLSLREKEFVEAARAIGMPSGRILLRVILPNCLSPLLVQASLGIGYAVLVEASLSFLGLGVQPPAPSWGSMLYYGRNLMQMAPWFVVFPGLAIFAAVLGFNFLGDALRVALDPRLRRLGGAPKSR